MDRLGYRRYGVQGGDCGAIVPPMAELPRTASLAFTSTPCYLPDRRPGRYGWGLTEAERARLAAMDEGQQRPGAYSSFRGPGRRPSVTC